MHDWLWPAIRHAIRDGELEQARTLLQLVDRPSIGRFPLLDALERGEASLSDLQAMLVAPTCYRSFDAYAADWPAGEHYRAWIGSKAGVWLIAGTGWHGGLPGGYLWAVALQRRDGWCVIVGDRDDGLVRLPCTDGPSTAQALADLADLAPLAMGELDAIGYRPE